MVDLLKDILVLENAINAFNEGTSDEKYAALCSLEKTLLEKTDAFYEFDAENAPKFQEDIFENMPV